MIFLVVLTFCTCIDPYLPKLSSYESVLVVDGLLTDENKPDQFLLTRTVQSNDSTPERVSDAVLTITDESGNSTGLLNLGGGIYETDTSEFRGETGRTYTLHIIDKDDNEYISDPCTMLPVPGIDSLYFQKDEEFVNNQSELDKGIRLYLDGAGGDDVSTDIRWEVEETWEYRLPSPRKYNYYKSDSIIPLKEVKEECWRSYDSEDILIHSMISVQGGSIMGVPLVFRATDKSDRFLVKYSALVRQYSISGEEYKFWNDLLKVSSSGGDIFDSQPFAVEGNIRSITNPEKKVLGYFKVSAVRQKRIFIEPGQLTPLDLPVYKYPCPSIIVSPDDYPPPNPFVAKMTFNGLYNMFAGDPKYTFVEPVYTETGDLYKLVFALVECSDCELTGTLTRPVFWSGQE